MLETETKPETGSSRPGSQVSKSPLWFLPRSLKRVSHRIEVEDHGTGLESMRKKTTTGRGMIHCDLTIRSRERMILVLETEWSMVAFRHHIHLSNQSIVPSIHRSINQSIKHSHSLHPSIHRGHLFPLPKYGPLSAVLPLTGGGKSQCRITKPRRGSSWAIKCRLS